MVIILKNDPNENQLNNLLCLLDKKGISVQKTVGVSKTILGLVGDTGAIDIDALRALDIVEDVKRIQEPFRLANRKLHPDDTIIKVGNAAIGDGSLTLIAGPCAIESEEQICMIAKSVKASGAALLRGGAFKPRTSPYSFQGLQEEGIRLLIKAREVSGLPIVTEITDAEQLPLFEDVDIIQVGARNMQNYELLKRLGKIDKPILLKRGLSATYDELIMSAEYIMSGGNGKVILCERGIRTFESYTRNTLDIAAIPVLKKRTHLTVIADPSHATGKADLVAPVSAAAAAVGADGLIIEVHNDPPRALSDGAQSIRCEEFEELSRQLKTLVKCIR